MSSDSRGKDNKSSLAHRAQQKYNAGKFVESIDALQKLSEEIAPQIDVKVQHNLVLAGFVSGKYSPKEFETNLRNLLISLTETLEKKKDKKNVDESSFSLEREASFIRYNLAACLFQQKQYAAASIVLEVLLRNIEPIDEKVAMHVCFLYLDIILHSSRGCITSEKERQATMKKAQSIMTYLEKPHGFNRQSVMKGSPIDSNSTSSTSTISTSTSSTTTTTNTTTTTSTTTTTTNDSNESGSSPDGTNGSGINTSNTTNMDIIEFRFRMHLYKSKLFLLESNLKTAKKEVKSALEIFQKEIKSRSEKQQEDTPMILSSEKTSITIGHPSLAVQNATGLFLKANMEYLRKNYPKCIKLLASCSQSAVDESIFLNNMGCLHYQMNQKNAAQSYFSRALGASTKPSKSIIASEEAVVLTNSVQCEVMYNNGIQLLLQGKFTLAFRCFHASSRLFFNRPKLWLRLGECCTAAFTEKQKHNACLGNKSGLIQGIVGSGAHRRVLLPTRIPSSESQDIIGTSDTAKSSSTGSSSAVAQSTTTTPDGLPRMNLPFAAKCFKNVVLLCTQLLAQDVSKKEDTTNSMASSQDPSVTSSSEVITTDSTDELDFLRQKALVNLAFVYLSMYEPHLAITHAKQLLDIPSCSKTNRFLACSYQAEALCMLSQSSEATEIFQSERDLIYMADEYAKEAKQSTSYARSSVHVNHATALILQGKFSKAEESVTRAVRENPSSREALELLVYVLLKKGDTKKALRVLKEAQVTK